MFRISTPASSANIGPGFDCLGLALDLCNTFDAALSERDILLNADPRFNNPDNLFLKAWHRGCEAIGAKDHVQVTFHCDIPSARGLGTSAALSAGGLYAASLLHDNALSREEIFRLCTEMEGHPDNAAPAVYGGLCLCVRDDGYTVLKRPVHPEWIFTVLVPDYEVRTEDARRVLPKMYDREVTVWNSARLVLLLDALAQGDMSLLHKAARDRVHEPYRRPLIPDFSLLETVCRDDTGGCLFISGSGSSCLLVSRRPLSDAAQKAISDTAEAHWDVKQLKCCENGPAAERITV